MKNEIARKEMLCNGIKRYRILAMKYYNMQSAKGNKARAGYTSLSNKITLLLNWDENLIFEKNGNVRISAIH